MLLLNSHIIHNTPSYFESSTTKQLRFDWDEVCAFLVIANERLES